MAESLKFGPEWLRSTIAPALTKDDTLNRPILSDLRYSREEMLSFYENREIDPKETVFSYKKLLRNHWEIPLSFQSDEREKEVEKPVITQSRLILNSSLKNNGGNWRRAPEEKHAENWRTLKDNGGTGIYFNNTYSKSLESIFW
jgi:hypothetical protein